MMRASALLMAGIAMLALAACTGSRPTGALDVGTGDTSSATAADPGRFATNAVDPLTAVARLRIAPVVGTPAPAAQALARQIQAQATAQGIALLAPQAANATHDLKGYFSAITEGGTTTVIYVWDVFDPAGNRLHRIQGQVAAPGTSPDGWSSVSSGTMEVIGTRTIGEFAAWLGQGS